MVLSLMFLLTNCLGILDKLGVVTVVVVDFGSANIYEEICAFNTRVDQHFLQCHSFNHIEYLKTCCMMVHLNGGTFNKYFHQSTEGVTLQVKYFHFVGNAHIMYYLV